MHHHVTSASDPNKKYAKISRSSSREDYFHVSYGLDFKDGTTIYVVEDEKDPGTKRAYIFSKSDNNYIGKIQGDYIIRFGKTLAQKKGYELHLFYSPTKVVMLSKSTDHRREHALIYAAYVHERISYSEYGKKESEKPDKGSSLKRVA